MAMKRCSGSVLIVQQCAMLRSAASLILISFALAAAPIKTVACQNAGPAIDVGKNPQPFNLSVMFTSPVDNPTRLFTRFANTKNKEFIVEKMTGPFDSCIFRTITQPVQGELQHSVTIEDAGNKGIKIGDKISFILHALAPAGSIFETRDTDPSTTSKDFRIVGKINGREVRKDIPLTDITFKATQVPEPGTFLCLLAGLTFFAVTGAVRKKRNGRLPRARDLRRGAATE